MVVLVETSLEKMPYSKDDVIQELNTTSSLLDTVSLTPNTRDIQRFKLYQRALHVFNGMYACGRKRLYFNKKIWQVILNERSCTLNQEMLSQKRK